MRPQKQANRHRPDEGLYGDCHRTCLAMLLDRDRDSVPNWADPNVCSPESERFFPAVKAWLATQGLAPFIIPFLGPLEDVLGAMCYYNPDTYYILGGQSRSGVNHSVVCYKAAIVADPSLNDSGIIGPCQPDDLYWVTVLIPLHQTGAP